jgi:hypothetical protein
VLGLAFQAGGIDEHLKGDQLIAEPDRLFVATDDGGWWERRALSSWVHDLKPQVNGLSLRLPRRG